MSPELRSIEIRLYLERKKKKKKIGGAIKYDHFSRLCSHSIHEEDEECLEYLRQYESSDQNPQCTFDELDCPITREELKKACGTLNRNKSSALDNVIYEYFKEGIDILEDPLEKLFNYILHKQTFPRSWSRGVIIPVFKKGDKSDPNNYRGISLICCFCKLFMSILNESVKKWTVENDVI